MWRPRMLCRRPTRSRSRLRPRTSSERSGCCRRSTSDGWTACSGPWSGPSASWRPAPPARSRPCRPDQRRRMSRTDTEAVRRVVTSDRVVASHAALVKDVDSLTATILRTRSVYAREVLASLAWPGHRAADLEAWAESGCPWPVVEPGMDPVALGQYGYVLAVQTGDPSERRRARRILEALAAADLLHRLRTRTVEMLAQLR